MGKNRERASWTHLFRPPDIGLDRDVLQVPASLRNTRYAEWAALLGGLMCGGSVVALVATSTPPVGQSGLSIIASLSILLGASFLLVGLIMRLIFVDYFIIDRRNRTVTIHGKSFGPDDIAEVAILEEVTSSGEGRVSIRYLMLGLTGPPPVWPDGEPSEEVSGWVKLTTIAMFDRGWSRELANQLALMLTAGLTEEGEYRNPLTIMERTHAQR